VVILGDVKNTHVPIGDGANIVATNSQALIRPEWIRLPKEGLTCPFSGLSRSYLADLVRRRVVPSKALRRPGTIRGVRLICYEGLMGYIKNAQEDVV
jgi:hypothetical protein